MWSTSLLNKVNLNTNFINNIGSTWADKIAETTWKVGGNTQRNLVNTLPATAYQNEVGSSSLVTTYSAKIGMRYISDYYLAASPNAWTVVGKNYGLVNRINWMYVRGIHEWTISPCSDNPTLAINTYASSGKCCC